MFQFIILLNAVTTATHFGNITTTHQTFEKNSLQSQVNMSSFVNSGQLQPTQFALDLLQLLHKDGSNLVLSPYSLVSALVMLLPGTDGESKAQIVKSLFNSNDSKGEDANKHVKLFAASNKDNLLKNKDTLKVANLLYSHKE